MEISIESSEESLHILQREVYHGKIEKKSEGLCDGAGAVCVLLCDFLCGMQLIGRQYAILACLGLVWAELK